MNDRYNVDILTALFKDHLLSGINNDAKNKNTIKNYLSDVRHFLGWIRTKALNQPLLNLMTQLNLENYKQYLIANQIPLVTINRRLSAVRSFCAFCQKKKLLLDNPAKNISNVINQQKKTAPTAKNYQPLPHYQPLPVQIIHQGEKKAFLQNKGKLFLIGLIGLLMLLFAGAVYFFQKTKQVSILPSNQIKKSRTIYFNGRLTDNLGNPIEENIKTEFSLYPGLEEKKPLYTSGQCSISPQPDGVFSVVIGKDCGRGIDANLFLDNDRVFLGVKIGEDQEMAPRQPIANVEYANNSAKLNGYELAQTDNANPEASQGAQINTIPLINQDGNLVIAADSPQIWSTSGTFQLRGQALTLITEPGSAGDIVLAPDNGGAVFINGLTTTNDDLQPSADNTFNLGSSDKRWSTIYTNELIASESGTQGYFQRNNNVITPTHISDDLTLGGTATESALIKFTGTAGGNSFVNTGNFGVGTSKPQEKLTLGKSAHLATEMATPTNVSVKSASGGALTAGTYYFKIAAADGVGVTIGSSEVSCTTNGTSLTRCSLSWDSVIGASSYRVYKGTTAGGQDRYQTLSNNFYNYDSDGGATLGALPSATTAYVNKWSGVGSSWLLGGNFGLGSTNPSKGKLQVDASRGTVVYINNTGTGNSIEDDSGAKLTAAGVWTDASDMSKKKNILNLTYGLNDLLKLRPVEYLWKNTDVKDIGFIAQEVQKILPELVYGTADNLSLSYGHLTALLVKSIQQQQEQITTLVNEVKTTLAVNNLNVNEKIISPVVQTENLTVTEKAEIKNLAAETISAEEIRPKKNDLIFSGISQFIIKGLNNSQIAVIDNVGNASFSGELTAESITTENATVSGTLTAENINAEQLSASSSSITNAEIENLTSTALSAQEASISSTLRAKTVEADNITDLQNQVNTLESSLSNMVTTGSTLTETEPTTANLNEIRQLLADLRQQPLPDPRYYQDLSQKPNLTVNENLLTEKQLTADALFISGQSSFYNVSISNSLTIGNVLFKDNSVLALGPELKLSSLGRVNLLDGSVIIAKDGSLTTRGTVIAQGGIRTNTIQPINSNEDISLVLNSKSQIPNSKLQTNLKFKIQNKRKEEVAFIDASGSAYFNDLAINKYTSATSSASIIAASDNFANNGIYAPAIETDVKTAGVAVLPAYTNEIIIYSDRVSDDSMIYLTPTSPTQNKTLFVAQKQSCIKQETELAETVSNCKNYFTAAIDKNINADIKFNWWIVN